MRRTSAWRRDLCVLVWSLALHQGCFDDGGRAQADAHAPAPNLDSSAPPDGAPDASTPVDATVDAGGDALAGADAAPPPNDLGAPLDGGDPTDAGPAVAEAALQLELLPRPNLPVILARWPGTITQPSEVTLRFGVFRGDTPVPGATIRFTSSAASRLPPPEPTRTNALGQASIRLVAGSHLGEALLTATTAIDGEGASVGLPTLVVEGPPSRLDVSCGPGAVPAVLDRLDADTWTLDLLAERECHIRSFDDQGAAAPGVWVYLLAEAGTVPARIITDLEGRGRFVHRAGGLPPFDREPDEAEGMGARAGFNPSDGVVRILAHADGSEPFTDVDGDRRYSPEVDLFGPEHDVDEPYLDINDNGRHDEPEPFVDVDGDGLWTSANGGWEAHAEIWASTTVRWVGPARDDRTHLRFVECPDCVRANCPNGEAFWLHDRSSAVLEFEAADVNGACPVGQLSISVPHHVGVEPFREVAVDVNCGSEPERAGPARVRFRVESRRRANFFTAQVRVELRDLEGRPQHVRTLDFCGGGD